MTKIEKKIINAFIGNMNYTKNGSVSSKKKNRNNANIKNLYSAIKHILRMIRQNSMGEDLTAKYFKDLIYLNTYLTVDKDNNHIEHKIIKEDDDIAKKILNDITIQINNNISSVNNQELSGHERTKEIGRRSVTKRRINKKYGEDSNFIIDEMYLDYSAEDIYLKLMKDNNLEITKITKPGINQIQSYIDGKETFKKKYTNETLIKEIIFTIPIHNEVELDESTLFQIVTNISDKMYKNHKTALLASHGDETTRHVHMLKHGYNSLTRNFDIRKTEKDYMMLNYGKEISKKTGKSINELKIMKTMDPNTLSIWGQFLQLAYRDISNEVLINRGLNYTIDKLNEEQLEQRLKLMTDKFEKSEYDLASYETRFNAQDKVLEDQKEKMDIYKQEISSIKNAIKNKRKEVVDINKSIVKIKKEHKLEIQHQQAEVLFHKNKVKELERLVDEYAEKEKLKIDKEMIIVKEEKIEKVEEELKDFILDTTDKYVESKRDIKVIEEAKIEKEKYEDLSEELIEKIEEINIVIERNKEDKSELDNYVKQRTERIKYIRNKDLPSKEEREEEKILVKENATDNSKIKKIDKIINKNIKEINKLSISPYRQR